MTDETTPADRYGAGVEKAVVREKPIRFSGPMVQAILDGRKTQTRLVLTPWCEEPPAFVDRGIVAALDERGRPYRWPRTVAVGDRLWVREAWSGPYRMGDIPPRDWMPGLPIWYWADGNPTGGDWTKPKPSIHMPRWASRLTLLVTEVRVERLNDISAHDAEAEGYPPCPSCGDVGWINEGPDGGWQCTAHGCGDAHVVQFRRLWESINGPRSWGANPWVVAISFATLPTPGGSDE